MINQIIDKLKRYAKASLAKIHSIKLELPIENDTFFCFAGEFGYEIISWIPYLLFLKEKTGIKINTIGRPGSKVFYYFSDNHIELESNEITGMWGDEKKYKQISNRLRINKMVHPFSYLVKERSININGYEWMNKDIHDKLTETNYIKPDFSNINTPLPFNFKKYVVINNKYERFKDNKYTKGWKKISPNYFDLQSLEQLKSTLLNLGYCVVYNRFLEKTAIDEDGGLNDENIFKEENTYDLRDWYINNSNQSECNSLQISTYNNAEFVIAVQGGNVYLPALCKKNILMIMREGDYIDYTELSRLNNTKLDAFYEPKHLLQWLVKKEI